MDATMESTKRATKSLTVIFRNTWRLTWMLRPISTRISYRKWRTWRETASGLPIISWIKKERNIILSCLGWISWSMRASMWFWSRSTPTLACRRAVLCSIRSSLHLFKICSSTLLTIFRIGLDPLFPPPYDWPQTKKYFLGENIIEESNKFTLFFDER